MVLQRFLRGAPVVAGVVLVWLACTGPATAQQSMTITDGELVGLTPTTLKVLFTSDAPTEGFVLAIAYDGDLVSVSDVGVSGQLVRSLEDAEDCDDGTTEDGLTCAELVVAEIFDDEGGLTLGVVLDSSPNTDGDFDGQTIPVGDDLEIASFEVVADGLPDPDDGDQEIVFEFMDDTFNSPILDNIIVQEGNSILILEDLETTSGTVTLTAPEPDSMTIDGHVITFAGTGTARVLLSNQSGVVQGFVTAIQHDHDELTLTSVDISADVDDIGAEFVESSVFATGGTLGVVLDFVQPFDGQTIPIGIDNHIADYTYRCDEAPAVGEDPLVAELEFVDGTLGNPPLDNVIVVAGLSLSTEFTNGSMSCEPPPEVDFELHLGGFDGEPLEAFTGDVKEVCITYQEQDSNIQGVSMSLLADSGLTFVEGSFSIEGTIVDDIGAEFVNENVDDAEMTIGILLDALPPFDDQTLPATLTETLQIGCFEIQVSEDVECDDVLAIEFVDGLTAGALVPVNNVVVIDFESFEGFKKEGTTVTVEVEPAFMRGDCNLDTRFNIADPAKVLAYSFEEASIGCEDACDGNDDGKINLADAIFLLNYLFREGREPEPPFPDLGTDPTEDDLGCEEGTNPCRP